MADFSGTPGLDSLHGTSGDDLFQAWPGSFTAGDLVDGGDGDDTLAVFGSIDFTGAGLAGFEFLSLAFDPNAPPPAAITVTFTAAQAAAGFSPNLFVAGSPAEDRIVIQGAAGLALDLSGWVLSNGGGGETLVYRGSAGEDQLSISTLSGTYLITLGAGADVLTLGGAVGQLNAADAIAVTDFEAGPGGDRLELDAFLDSALQGRATGEDPFASGHLRLVQNGADVQLQADADGGGDSFSTLLTLRNVNAFTLTPDNLGGYASGLTAPAPQAGGTGSDTLTGGAAADNLQGLDGDDSLRGGAGSDLIDGGSGFDVALYAGAYRGYVVGPRGATVAGGPEGGTDAVTHVERLQFVDGYFSTEAGQTDTAASVYRLYQTMLNRTPDSAGLASWVQAIDFKGSNLKAVADGFIGSPEFNSTYGALNNDQFVELMYANVLHRASDTQGKANWVGLLNGGGTRADVAIGFSQSNENVSNLSDAIQNGVWVGHPNAGVAARFYDTVFGRLPDAGGLDTWTKALNAGASLQSVANGFVASTEFQTTYGALNNAQFVELMYQNVLHRPSDSGRQTWINLLNGSGSRAQVVVGFSESPEHIRLTAPHIDDGVWVA